MADGIYPKYVSGLQAGSTLGRNQLAMAQALAEKQRQDQIRNIFAQAYRPASADYMPEAPAMGPVQPGAAPLPAYPEQGEAAGGGYPEAMTEMYRQGMGPEALSIEKGFLTAKGTAPSAVREYEYYKSLKTPEERANYMLLKRQGYSIQDLAGVPTMVSSIPGLPNIPLSTFQAELTAAAEQQKAGGLGALAASQVKTASETLPKIAQNITNLNEVVRLVGEGANTGPIVSKFPSFQRASVELENMRSRLGLDVVGATTFGALSKGELDLALSTALPTNLRGRDLVKWANDKIAAQEKLYAYFQDQVSFLSQPGNSVSDWYELQSKTKRETVPMPKTQAEYDALPSGAIYIDPDDNKRYKKP